MRRRGGRDEEEVERGGEGGEGGVGGEGGAQRLEAVERLWKDVGSGRAASMMRGPMSGAEL